ncbi:hypothetical protein PanWU01x14_231150 [Parasponia andersonii]|uniref:Uncharacterized protein n=1 Tax=Parasponia andersonii TaxID=3476 RepID=A0A2P5BKD0_PARAD|nr:hypothetical protein PanWU01x14_231150 [Parasponia andersonii]
MTPRRRVLRQEPRIDTPPPRQEIPDPLMDLYEVWQEILGLRAQRDPEACQARFLNDFIELSPLIFDCKSDLTVTEK